METIYKVLIILIVLVPLMIGSVLWTIMITPFFLINRAMNSKMTKENLKTKLFFLSMYLLGLIIFCGSIYGAIKISYL